MSSLSEKHCIPCEGDMPPLSPAQARDLMEQVPGWELSEDAAKLSRTFRFDDFAKALAFANEVGKIAEEDWHHPDLRVSWGKVGITLTTHSIKGLSENDFIVAAKINLLPAGRI